MRSSHDCWKVKMKTGVCYRCGFCCAKILVPKDENSNLDPEYLEALADKHGAEFAKKYAEENSTSAGDRCPWLMDNPDGFTTTCGAYERRSYTCRMHNSDGECVVGLLVMSQYGFLNG